MHARAGGEPVEVSTVAASNCRRRVSGYDVTNPGVRVFEEIEADEVGRMRSTRLGDATLQECEVGPLTVPDHQLAVDHGASGQVRSSRERYYSRWGLSGEPGEKVISLGVMRIDPMDRNVPSNRPC